MSTSKDRAIPFKLQERDLAILTGLFESRVMTAAHVAALYFEGRAEAAKKRLQAIKAAGLVGERRRSVNEPATLFVAKKGFSLLESRGILQMYPPLSLPALEKRAQVSDLTIRHELEVMDVKAAFHSALRGNPTYSIAEFGTWPRLYEFEAFIQPGEKAVVRPDGFARIHEKESDGGLSEHTFFLENDRSSESLDRLVFRAAGYLDYYKSGGFAAKNGALRSAFKDYPFRVLIVCKSAERRNNIAERLLEQVPPILTQVCLSTIDDVRRDPLGTIWIRPVDYRAAVKGTAYETGMHASRWGYQRQAEREALVEKSVRKCRLLSAE